MKLSDIINKSIIDHHLIRYRELEYLEKTSSDKLKFHMNTMNLIWEVEERIEEFDVIKSNELDTLNVDFISLRSLFEFYNLKYDDTVELKIKEDINKERFKYLNYKDWC